MPSLAVKGQQFSTKAKPESKPRRIFQTVDEIQAALRSQSDQTLILDLTALRNQLSLRSDDLKLSPQDERLKLARNWMERNSGARDVFELIGENSQQRAITALLISVLGNILGLLSVHYTDQQLGLPIVKTILLPQSMRQFGNYLGSSHSELILVSLKLMNTVSAFAGGRERKALLETFPWELKTLPKLLHMRRKSNNDELDPLARPDIRTLYLLLIVSFIDSNSSSQLKTTFLEHHRDAFLAIFKGIDQDAYPVVRRVLEVCWTGLWEDPKVSRSIKIGAFNESTISKIVQLYGRTESEGADDTLVPANLVHHFLLGLCTHPGSGLCFRDRGWYPRLVDDDRPESELEGGKSGRIHNKILSNILKTLKVNEDARQLELALKIMEACPELVASYWSAVSLTLEPRLSSKWITNVAILGSVVSLPVPVSSFRLPDNEQYNPTPPPIATILENVFPTAAHTKLYFSKGLQSSSPLVQHCTALALAKCLTKYARVQSELRKVSYSLGEDATFGLWVVCSNSLEREGRQRVPDVQVIVAFAQQQQKAESGNVTNAMLSESATRLLWLYHRCLPFLVEEAHFDVGKLLQFSTSNIGVDKEADSSTEHGVAQLQAVRQHHILRLLKESRQFLWTSKSPSSPHTYFHILLTSYNTSSVHAIRLAHVDLLEHALGESVIFRANPNEVPIWLHALRNAPRSSDAETLDGTPLSPEGPAVISFLDDCAQRCARAPYKYLEDMSSVLRDDTADDDGDDSMARTRTLEVLYFSPLLMTVLEQFKAKLTARLLTPSDVLAITSYMRRVILGLMGVVRDLAVLEKFTKHLANAIKVTDMLDPAPAIKKAVNREVGIINRYLLHSYTPLSNDFAVGKETLRFLEQVEAVPIPTTTAARVIAANELVDWIRLADQKLGVDEIKRLANIISKFHEGALRELAENLDPTTSILWKGLSVTEEQNKINASLTFALLLMHSTMEEIANPNCVTKMLDVLLLPQPTIDNVIQAFNLLSHDLVRSWKRSGDATKYLLAILCSLVGKAKVTLTHDDFEALKLHALESGVVREMCTSTIKEASVRSALETLIGSLLNPGVPADRNLVQSVTKYWIDELRANLLSGKRQEPFIKFCIRYLEPNVLFDVLDLVSGFPTHNSFVEYSETVLCAIRKVLDSGICFDDLGFQTRVASLTKYQYLLPDSTVLEAVIADVLETYVPMGIANKRLEGGSKLDKLVSLAEARWRRSNELATLGLDLSAFLDKEVWRDSTIKIITTVLYKQSTPNKLLVRLLSKEYLQRHALEHTVAVLDAYLEVCLSRNYSLDTEELAILSSNFDLILNGALEERNRDLAAGCGSCICSVISLSQDPIFEANMAKRIRLIPFKKITTNILDIWCSLLPTRLEGCAHIVEALSDLGLQNAVRCFSGETLEDPSYVLSLTSFLRVSKAAKLHLAEPLIATIIQHHLESSVALDFFDSIIQVTSFKPVLVNRFLQSIIQSHSFLKLCADTSRRTEQLVRILHALFHLHPQNTCQPSHVEPLTRIYSASLSRANLMILSIFRLFETQRQTPVTSIVSKWSPLPGGLTSDTLDAISNLDANRVLRTCCTFPKWRTVEDQGDHVSSVRDDQLYDPVFLVLLVGCMLSGTLPSNTSGWVGFFRTNVVSLMIQCLSSPCADLRELALCQIVGVWKCLEFADLQEKPHVSYILHILKDILPTPTSPSYGLPPRLPTYTTLLLSHSLRAVFYPSTFIYPHTMRFLLQRPMFDTNDVPMLYALLYSGDSEQWRKERSWILRFLSDGLAGRDDWRVFKRRFGWDLVGTMFQALKSDNGLRAGVFDILANVTCIQQAITSLVTKSAFPVWLEMQLNQSRTQLNHESETVLWVKVIQNIFTHADAHKLNNFDDGRWKLVLGRCLIVLLEDRLQLSLTTILPLISSTILKLSLLPGKPIPIFSSILSHALSLLKLFEKQITTPSSNSDRSNPSNALPVFYNSHNLRDPPASENDLWIWGKAVEDLWRASMAGFELSNEESGFVKTEVKNSKTGSGLQRENIRIWASLTSRLLVLRSLVGKKRSGVGEWARMEVMRNI